jgi:anti-sigma regulatory factor (Ser/Thr protein kinase)
VRIPADLARENKAVITQIVGDFAKHADLNTDLCTGIIREHLGRHFPGGPVSSELVEKTKALIRPMLFHPPEGDRTEGDTKVQYGLSLGLEEAFVNHVEHGNGCNPMGLMVVNYVMESGTGKLIINSRDEGPGFDPDKVPDPTAIENLEKERGRGILLIRYYFDEAEYLGNGNALRMVLDWGKRIREAIDEVAPKL